MSHVSFDEIRKFTIEELWNLPGGVTEQSALAHDFSIAGLDGKEFMEKYSTKYGVDLTGFDWLYYFGPEASPSPLAIIPYMWSRFIIGIPARKLINLPELTLGHLVKCANLGKWVAPKPNA